MWQMKTVHTHTQTLSLSHTHTHTLSLSLSLSLSHTHTHTSMWQMQTVHAKDATFVYKAFRVDPSQNFLIFFLIQSDRNRIFLNFQPHKLSPRVKSFEKIISVHINSNLSEFFLPIQFESNIKANLLGLGLSLRIKSF